MWPVSSDVVRYLDTLENHNYACRCLNIYKMVLSDSGPVVLYSLTFCHMLPDSCHMQRKYIQSQEKNKYLKAFDLAQANIHPNLS